MASWREERDRLVAQTLAFVQQVAASHPAAASKLGLASGTAPAEEPDALSPLPHAIEVHPAEIHLSDGDGSIADSPLSPITQEQIAGPMKIVADLPKRPVQYAKVSERSQITQRVAAFKARQLTLNREREAYYDSVQARIRSSLGNDPDAGRL